MVLVGICVLPLLVPGHRRGLTSGVGHLNFLTVVGVGLIVVIGGVLRLKAGVVFAPDFVEVRVLLR